MAPRNERTRAIIEQGKRFVQHQTKVAKREQEKQIKLAAKGKNANGRRIDEEAKLEEEVIKGYHDRQAKLQRIGSFKFDIDNDLDVEILTSD